MKHFKSILRLLILPFLLLNGTILHAQEHPFGAEHKAETPVVSDTDWQHLDSAVHVSLLTCQPGEEAYSLYGHTAIHYINTDKRLDIAINYGMFDFRKPHFVLRFIFGLTDYEMGIQPYHYFCAAYANERRGIVEQELNLSPQAKQIFCDLVEENYRPENREYRYNIFYNNCTTKARDLIEQCLETPIVYQRKENGPTLRELTHLYTQQQPWAQLGNDLLLGLKADRPTTVSEQQFLPENLMDDFEHATIHGQKLVIQTTPVVEWFENETPAGFPLSPLTCSLMLAILIIVVTLYEYKSQRTLWGFDLPLLLLIGLSGLVLTAMVFSKHPTVNLNLQILLLNPLALVCLIPVVRKERRRHYHWFWSVYAICLLLFFAGNILQCYAEGANLLALSLLTRCCERIIHQKNRKSIYHK